MKHFFLTHKLKYCLLKKNSNYIMSQKSENNNFFLTSSLASNNG